jgi:CO/xanthine dehydrogenase Mo-binding subunit
MVVAETLDQAEHAAAALRVTYSAGVPVVDPGDPRAKAVVPEAGTRPDAHLPADKARGDADAALGAAPVRIEASYDIARENHNPMEPHATVAAWNGERLTLWSKSQYVVYEQAEIAAIFGLPPENVQVIAVRRRNDRKATAAGGADDELSEHLYSASEQRLHAVMSAKRPSPATAACLEVGLAPYGQTGGRHLFLRSRNRA